LKKTVIILIALGTFISANAQMYPWFTQYRSNMFMYNPAFCGTKRFIDARLFYRNQWTGYKGAPKTYAATLNMRYANGKMGTGISFFNDEIGPFKNTLIAFTLAYHLKFDDVELSVGLQGNYLEQIFNGTKITLHNQIDKGINQYISDKQKMYDGGIGLVLLNDRFYLGLAANNLVGNQMVHYAGDPFYKGKYQNVPSFCIGAGFNYADNPDYTFENSVMALYTSGVPFYFDYTLRLHIQKSLLTGISIRLQDAVALHLGFNVKNQFQVAYSYDIITSPLKKYSGGSHEISVVFSSNLGRDEKKRGFNGRFLKQKFQYLL
jgi:type IX secretion system PorP/SprF family membrane protein